MKPATAKGRCSGIHGDQLHRAWLLKHGADDVLERPDSYPAESVIQPSRRAAYTRLANPSGSNRSKDRYARRMSRRWRPPAARYTIDEGGNMRKETVAAEQDGLFLTALDARTKPLDADA